MLVYLYHITGNRVVQITTFQNRVVQMHHWTRPNAGAVLHPRQNLYFKFLMTDCQAQLRLSHVIHRTNQIRLFNLSKPKSQGSLILPFDWSIIIIRLLSLNQSFLIIDLFDFTHIIFFKERRKF